MKSFCPLSRQYAVIQMDPVGMVKHFDDPIALAAAQTMRPKKYLVYLDHAIDLPSLTNPWFRYKVSPIATTLRPEDSEAGITSDMVIPIYPNTYHPSGHREPIHTHPTFPFPNCFHWIKNTLTIRVRRMATRYDDANAYKVTFFQHLEIDKGFWPDQLRAAAYLQAKRAALEEAATPRDAAGHELRRSSLDSSPESRLSASDVDSYDSDDMDSLPDGPEEPVDTDDTDPSASRPASHSVDAAMNSLEALFKMNIFGFEVDDTAELMPLVDLWFELTDHLTPETIPSPTELYEEHEEIMRIIHDARERAPSIRAPFIDNGVAIDFDNLSSLESVNTDDLCRDDLAHERPELRLRYGIPLDEEIYPDQPVPHRTAFTIFKTLKRRTKKVLNVIVPWRNHPPCLPYWY